MYGVFGDELFMAYRQSNQKWVSGLMRADTYSNLPTAYRFHSNGNCMTLWADL
jgi:hypothetical protein